jgi:hypothetical protein
MTEKFVNLFLLKTLQIFLILIVSLSLLILGNLAQAQDFTLIKSIKKDGIDKVSADRNGNIYLSDTKGNVEKYSPEGNFLNVFSPSRPARLDILEAWEGMRCFIFNKDLQEFVFLDRFLNISSSGNFKSPSLGFVRIATIANDNNIWLVDDSDFSIKKYNPTNGSILLSTPLNLVLENGIYDFSFIKEYQNYLYLTDPFRGIYIFDNLGNYISTIPGKKEGNLSFYKDKVHFVRNGKLISINLYDFSSIEKIQEKGYIAQLKSDAYFYLFKRNSFEIYKEK